MGAVGRAPVAAVMTARRPWALLAALLLVAANLRPAIASVPPLLGLLQADLGLSGAAAGLLTTLPVLCLSLFAPVAARLAGRLGPERALSAALGLVAAGILVRGAAPAQPPLFAGTVLAGAGIAIGGALLPGVVKAYFPGRPGTVTGLYTAALATGAMAAAAATAPLLDLLGGRWQYALATWSAPALLGLAVWIPLTHRPTRRPGAGPPDTGEAGRPDRPGPPDPPGRSRSELSHTGRPDRPGVSPSRTGPPDPPGRSRSELSHAGRPGRPGGGPPGTGRAGRTDGSGGLPWRSRTAWRVSGYMGTQSLLYYSALTWLAPRYTELGWTKAGAGLLLALFSAVQVGSAVAIPALSDRSRNRRPWIMLCAGVSMLAFTAVALVPLAAPAVWATLLGLTAGGQFALALSLLVDLSDSPAAAQRLAGMAFLVGYGIAAVGPVLTGALHDAAGGFTAPFLVLAGLAGVTLTVGTSIRRDSQVV